MDGRRYAPWVLVLSLVSCGPDGGTSGTGALSDTVETLVEGAVGNVRVARLQSGTSWWMAAGRFLWTAPLAVAQGGVEGIEVWIEGTGLRTVTDPEGRFALRGDFGDRIQLVFRDGSGDESRLGLAVPTGGHLWVQGVVVDFASGTASSAGQEVRFEAIVRTVDCLASRITVASRFDPSGLEYAVRTDGASLERSDGEPVGCRDLRPGDEVAVSGPIDPDGTVGDAPGRTGQAVSNVDL